MSVSPEELESSTCRLEVGRSGPVELRAQGRVLGRNRTDAGGFAGHCLAAWRRGRRSPGGNRTLTLPVRNRASLSVGPRGCQHLKNPARDSNPEPRLSESRVRPLHFRGTGIECPGLEPGAPAVRRRCASVATEPPWERVSATRGEEVLQGACTLLMRQWTGRESNPESPPCERGALPIELPALERGAGIEPATSGM